MSSLFNIRLLHRLARQYGIQTAYYDVNHRRQQAPLESLTAVLQSLGAPITTPGDIHSAWRERHQALWQRLMEPVILAWDTEPPAIKINLKLTSSQARLNCNLKLESGEEHRWQYHGDDLPEVDSAKIEGTRYSVRQLHLPVGLPLGYHRLTVEILGRNQEALIISAPRRAYIPPAASGNHSWGVFIPLYSLGTAESWGAGTFSDLEKLATWVAGMGGGVLATLPILASFLDNIYEPSPYLPSSRRLWNEFYLDVYKVPELPGCPSAQTMLASAPFRKDIEALRRAPLVDYHRQMALKRRVLEELCRCFFSEPSPRLDDLHRFAETNPLVEDYARFRAACEKHRSPWRSWPQPLRDGVFRETDYDEASRRYHLYVQWLAHQQIEGVWQNARRKGIQLYLDLPVGVHPDSYDVWREQNSFILGASAGAPPDSVFTKGQNWEFHPLHPERIREQGYRYIIACLRHHLRYAGILRIDHVMGLHRLFCIPRGLEASQGVYLRYPSDDLYAILALESHRHQAIIVGEDLGTVPSYVRPAMKEHNFHRMYVLHYELATEPQKGLHPVPHSSVASLNTHDMPPFAAFWQGSDIEERRQLGLLNRAGAARERQTRQYTIKALSTFLRQKGLLKEAPADAFSALKACLSFLAGSRARIVLVNLEDLWLETKSQNVPSTGKEKYPIWRRKARYSLEEFCQMPQVLDTLHIINRLRQQGRYRK
jgi:4-alpha-glucanotransferase